MRIIDYTSLDLTSIESLCIRRSHNSPDVQTSVRGICESVRTGGDAAIRQLSEQYDGVRLERFNVTEDERPAAMVHISSGLIDALTVAINNIRVFHEHQRNSDYRLNTMPGVSCWREMRPIERVGLYVPAGSAPLPSTVLMLGIPAKLAGCNRIVLCSPPKWPGLVDPYVLAAAHLVGITEIYKIGGAQAIAAMAYGTESISRVDKIFGPGNRYVTAAKQYVSSDVTGCAIDLLAGPSELLIIADEHADPALLAVDLLSQAEHDPDSQVLLVTPSRKIAEQTLEKLQQLLNILPRNHVATRSLSRSFALTTPTISEAMAFSNQYAPEHLILNTRNANDLIPQVQNAGSVFLGEWSPVAAGDYASGTNHTLPTGGTARWCGGITVESFQKPVTFQQLSKSGFERLAPTIMTLADAEGLLAHSKSVSIRLGDCE